MRLAFSRLLNRVLRAMGAPLARVARLRRGIEIRDVGLSVVPGLLTCNIGFRAGESGRVHRFLPRRPIAGR